MASEKLLLPILILIFSGRIESASLFESSYQYVINLGKNFAPSLMSIFDCMAEQEAWSCAKEKAGKILDGWSEEVDNERRSWQEQADTEVRSTGRSLEEMPSKIGEEVETTLESISEMITHGVARAFTSRKKHHDSGGIDSITISTGGEKKKMKKKKPKPPKIHLLHMVPMKKAQKEEKGRSFPNGRQSWVIGDIQSNDSTMTDVDAETDLTKPDTDMTQPDIGRMGPDAGMIRPDTDMTQPDIGMIRPDAGMTRPDVDITRPDTGMARADVSVRRARGYMSDFWSMGEEALDAIAEHAIETENKDNGIEDKSSITEQRGKKKKKKKAILKLLILGAVLKAKIGTLLQILSFKLQVKFFIVALLGLAINLARLWIDLKNKHNHQPQKVIYYEHAQHQHHYDHEDEHEHGWGPWSRTMEPEDQADVEVDMDFQNSPYRGQERPLYRQQINV